MILGITGGSGCGKTTLLRLIGEAGGLILDCDAIYHELLRRDEAMLSAISRRFPGTVTDGVLDQKKLGTLVFSHEDALRDLNAITHSAVRREVLHRLESSSGLAAIDAIALLESGLGELCDVTVAVTAPEEARIRRLVARDGISPDYARSRIAAQKDPSWFCQNCDYVLENDRDAEAFHGKCIAFLRNLGIM